MAIPHLRCGFCDPGEAEEAEDDADAGGDSGGVQIEGLTQTGGDEGSEDDDDD